jgi:putative two-component system response regulator
MEIEGPAMEILIVDDSPIALEMLEFNLKACGYDVLIARDGSEALDLLDTTECSLVITDWEMPGLSGVDLCSAIRHAGFSRYIYTILLTSRAGVTDAVEGLTAGADDFIVKPFHPLELMARVRTGERIVALESRDLTIFALAKLAESRDVETGAHLERVRHYSRAIAEQLAATPKCSKQITPEFLKLIFLTSPLHDIGKVAVPDRVLLKPGKLTTEEFELMKLHTTEGAKTLEAALQAYPGAKYLQMAVDIAKAHHERFDGSGYPSGLAGEAIPLAARIVALADVYDALTTKRVYKEAFDDDEAHRIIVEGRGKHFDPLVVDAFLNCEQQIREIRLQFAEPEHEMALV